MAEAPLKTVTNTSKQTVPIIVNTISESTKNSKSDVPASKSYQLQIPPGSQLAVESSRLDNAQLEQLQSLGLIKVQ